MDSTFIGLLVGLTKLADTTIYAPFPAELPEDMESIGAEKATLELLLESHEALMATTAENRTRFSVLKDLLEKKLSAGNPQE